MFTSFSKTNRTVTIVTEDKQNISEQQPISNHVEEILSDKIQEAVIPIISKRKTKLI